MARGRAWRCIGFGRSGVDSAHCFPEEDCDPGEEDYTLPCATFDDGLCADAFNQFTGVHFTFCAASSIIP